MLPQPEPDWLALRNAVKRFEDAWRLAPRPGIDNFLPTSAPLRFRALIELVHIDLELRLRAGERVRVEEYLARFPELTADSAIALELIADEHALRQLREPGLRLDEYLQRFPQYRGAMVQHGWLTPFQVNQILEGSSQKLSFGPYLLLDRLGEGGMGEVFKARHIRLDRIVAIKLIRKECLAEVEAIKRFRREIQAAARLDHPNVVHALDADEVDGTHFYVMEYIEGTDLDRLVEEKGPLPIRQACDCIRQAALGLQHAHERNMVHRDIKPHNLLLARNGTVKILDMGLARFQADVDASTLTKEGYFVGTADYISPEQAMNSRTVDIRGDLYSLGCTLYHLLTGQVPFPGGTVMEKLSNHGFQEPRPVEQLRPEVPQAVAAVVPKLMAKDPKDRYQTPAELAAVLASILQRLPGQSGALTAALPGMAHSLATADTAADPVRNPQKARRRRQWRKAVVAVGLLALVGLFSVLLFRGTGSSPDTTAHRVDPNAPPLASAPFDEEQAKEYQRRWAEYLNVKVNETNTIGMHLNLIPPGQFTMGSPDNEPARQPHEGPLHDVTITQAFYMGTHEVTMRQYADFLRDSRLEVNGPAEATGAAGDHPIAEVGWSDAEAFCQWLSQKEGKKYALPTEAQWEYACRAGSQAMFSFGEDDRKLAEYSWYTINANSKTHPVGGKKPNAWGLYDMYGNVWEWIGDWYQADYYQVSPALDPPGPSAGTNRVLRGGGWNRDLPHVRSAARYGDAAPSTQDTNVGFRVVMAVSCQNPR